VNDFFLLAFTYSGKTAGFVIIEVVHINRHDEQKVERCPRCNGTEIVKRGKQRSKQASKQIREVLVWYRDKRRDKIKGDNALKIRRNCVS
jgi:hypothetical protein